MTIEEMEQSGDYESYQSMAIAFAKYHVQEALKAATQEISVSIYYDEGENPFTEIDYNSILNSYPLDNIK